MIVFIFLASLAVNGNSFDEERCDFTRQRLEAVPGDWVIWGDDNHDIMMLPEQQEECRNSSLNHH
jgi:hypothetical protein